ncbi:Fanconi anemia group I protein [Macrosteles quadrilineatus]|uniref:Fanconi anemia group I protein n=1 Tax=Macrosteles quadrilineatus TaxID=74068 RepID=UPI0023E12CCC|nr:Fanconi anemia group I protein [Macrosteles quadrilineatus]
MFKRLNDLGQTKLKNPESTELNEYVDSLDGNEIVSTLKENLLKPEAPQALNYLLLGFSEKSTSQKKRLKVCEAIINEIQGCDISSRSSVALSSRIAQELGKFPTSHLVSVAQLCVDFIRSSTADSQTCWKELLPKVLAEVESHREVEYAGAEMSGAEFKQRIVQVICSTSWDSGVATSLASMFIDVELSEEEHLQVVNKLCSYFNKMSPQEIPPLVHQLLILCKNQHGVTVVLSLRHYFNSKIYNKKKVPAEDPDSISSIMECDSREMGDCESTVLYHIEEAAKLSRGSVIDLKLCQQSRAYIYPDLFTVECDSREMGDCESTVLYHIEEAAKLSRGSVIDLKLCQQSRAYIYPDLFTVECDSREMGDCESTVLYHIEDAAKLSRVECDSREMGDCESMVLYLIEKADKLSRGCVIDLKSCQQSRAYIYPDLFTVECDSREMGDCESMVPHRGGGQAV